MNDNYGLGAYSEEGLESCNKLLRKIRISLSRKTNKDDNQIDCIRRLWFRSDPEVNFIRSQAKPSHFVRNVIPVDTGQDIVHLES